LTGEVKAHLHEKVTFKQRHKGGEGVSLEEVRECPSRMKASAKSLREGRAWCI
jgi:hypothetical protein